ncbi:MAG TPA: flagellin [Blastocatellia bacterium]|nr:flagellin [Blastocatellia bacterium]
MAVSLINNLGSLASQTRLNATSTKLNSTIQRLSSGLRINNSGEDAAGLSIANKFRSDVAILTQGVRNANDGASTLQIIDGGLNTISNLLDRASTLATQSASDTFTGDRNTLQLEYGKILDEITRQAQNVGLVQNGRYNTTLATVIGGGSDSYSASNSNTGVSIDLSGSANRVDATSLGLTSTNIGSFGKVGRAGSTAADFRDTSASVTAETLTFQVLQSDGTFGTAFNVAISAGTTTAALSSLNANASLQSAGITVSVNSQTGSLEFNSGSLFKVYSSANAAATNSGISATAGDIQFSSNGNNTTITATANTAAANQTLALTIASTGEVVNVTVAGGAAATAETNADTLEAAVNANQKLRDAGIVAIRTANGATGGAGVRIVSAKSSFTYTIAETSTGSSADRTLGAPTVGTQTITAATDSGATGAKKALDSLKTAIANLGKVQGTVGSGQNRLQQAIELATSQITNFQSAESRIRDADVTAEASNLARLSVLQQAGVAALAQANQSSQAVLSLLRG